MTKAELIDQIAQKAGLESKGVAEKALSATIEVLRESLVAGESVTLTGFGTFKVVERAARKCRNPRTQQEMEIPACKVASTSGGMAEWLNAAVLKTVEGVSPPGVQIPFPPPGIRKQSLFDFAVDKDCFVFIVCHPVMAYICFSLYSEKQNILCKNCIETNAFPLLSELEV